MQAIEPTMVPAPGERLCRFVGDRVQFGLTSSARPLPQGWRAFLRTNLGRGQELRREIIQARTSGVAPAGGPGAMCP